ncbi:hypothetical protein QCA50_004401 [Cerrena zonata]|uniref:Copper transport protein n=1 Tax=Cerrena zonata TaxID=2478898 RepID=A0AAW0GH75_9APHY
MDGMTMSSGSTSSGSITSDGDMLMMTPYLHFSGGDNLLFKSWRPSSVGALTGACIGLILLAVLDRWMAAVRGLLEVRWEQHALAVMYNSNLLRGDGACCDMEAEELEFKGSSLQGPAAIYAPRSLPPFIPSHDLARGLLFALQVLLHYLLMLSVMTFQAAYFISVVVGLGIGEVFFGRMGMRSSHVH